MLLTAHFQPAKIWYDLESLQTLDVLECPFKDNCLMCNMTRNFILARLRSKLILQQISHQLIILSTGSSFRPGIQKENETSQDAYFKRPMKNQSFENNEVVSTNFCWFWFATGEIVLAPALSRMHEENLYFDLGAI